MSACINKIPKGLLPLPTAPEGYDAWEYMGTEWVSETPNGPWNCRFSTRDKWCMHNASAGTPCYGSPSLHYIRAVKLPAKKPMAKTANRLRREPLKMQFASAIQTGKRNEAMSALDIAEDCMRLLDNHQRAKRRKEGK